MIQLADLQKYIRIRIAELNSTPSQGSQYQLLELKYLQEYILDKLLAEDCLRHSINESERKVS
jgi:hypothetical protein